MAKYQTIECDFCGCTIHDRRLGSLSFKAKVLTSRSFIPFNWGSFWDNTRIYMCSECREDISEMLKSKRKNKFAT